MFTQSGARQRDVFCIKKQGFSASMHQLDNDVEPVRTKEMISGTPQAPDK